MIRALLIALVGCAALYLIATLTLRAFDPKHRPGLDGGLLTTRQHDDCSDDCEQRSIIEKWPDGQLQACRVECNQRGGITQPTSGRGRGDPPSRITVAPADHRVDPQFAPPAKPGEARDQRAARPPVPGSAP